MSNKQSSVEWYIEKIRDLDYQYAKGIITLGVWSKRKNDLIEQAKAMHKEEVLSFDTLLDKHEIEALNNNTILLTKEEFYNETFGGNNEQQ